MSIKVETKIKNTKATESTPKREEKKYKDPLNSWGVRVLMYSSEVGATVNEIAPNLTFALWVPAFMYLGADIYDKYKNDKNKFSPSGKRGMKEVIRQALTFFILPSAATIFGQKLTSPIGKLISDKLSINAKDGIYRHSKSVIEQSLHEHLSNKENFKEFMKTSLENRVKSLANTKETDNIFRKFYRYFTGYFSMVDADDKKLYSFAEKNADKIIELKEKLQNNNIDKSIPKRIFKKYHEVLPIMQKIYGKDYTENALKTALKDYQNYLIVKNKIIKTIGGVISCLLFTQPISYLVNKILMPKYITPGMDIIISKFNESNLLRQHVEKVDKTRKKIIQSKSILNVSEKKYNHSRDYSKDLYFEYPQEDPEHTFLQQISQLHSKQEKTSLKK